MKSHTTSLRRRQVDRMLEASALREVRTPPRGWIAEVRGLIGVRSAQIASKLGISAAAVLQFERSEAERTIALNTLDKVAATLGCRLVYAFVPLESSFEDMVQIRAEHVARQMVGEVSHTMALEDQSLAVRQQQDLVAEMTGDLVRKLPRRLWDESP